MHRWRVQPTHVTKRVWPKQSADDRPIFDLAQQFFADRPAVVVDRLGHLKREFPIADAARGVDREDQFKIDPRCRVRRRDRHHRRDEQRGGQFYAKDPRY